MHEVDLAKEKHPEKIRFAKNKINSIRQSQNFSFALTSSWLFVRESCHWRGNLTAKDNRFFCLVPTSNTTFKQMLMPYLLLGALKIFTKRCMLGPLQKHAVQPIINIDTTKKKKKKLYLQRCCRYYKFYYMTFTKRCKNCLSLGWLFKGKFMNPFDVFEISLFTSITLCSIFNIFPESKVRAWCWGLKTIIDGK